MSRFSLPKRYGKALAADMFGAAMELFGFSATETYGGHRRRIERESQAGVIPSLKIQVTPPRDGKLSGYLGRNPTK